MLLLQNDVFIRDVIKDPVNLYTCCISLTHYLTLQSQYPLHQPGLPPGQTSTAGNDVRRSCPMHWALVHEQLHVSCAHDKNICTLTIILMHYYSSGHLWLVHVLETDSICNLNTCEMTNKSIWAGSIYFVNLGKAWFDSYV